jgi:predicted aspartyl protease
MKRAYDEDFTPSAPVVPVVVSGPAAGRERQLDGKIDTGADICALPDIVIAELAIPPTSTLRAAGYAGELREMVVYRVNISIDGKLHKNVKALSTRRPYVIIGRNVLRAYILRLDGSKQTLEIKRP